MIKQLLQEGFSLKNQRHYKHAIEVFYKALELDNTSPELMLEIADLYYKLNNEEKALNYIEQILENYPQHIEALNLLKAIFIKQNALLEAEQTAKNIYCISHKTKDLVEIFKLLNLQGKFNEIFEYNIEHTNDKICLEKAKALFYMNELEKCKNYILDIINQYPQNQELLLLLSKTFYALDNIKECENTINQMVPNLDPEYLNLKGLIEYNNNNVTNAKKIIKKAIDIAPQNARFYYNLANIFFKEGDTNFAKIYYTHAINLDPKNRTYHLAIANLFYSLKQYKRAIEELYDDYFEANLLKSIILYDTGYIALARKEINKLFIEQPENEIVKRYKKNIESELDIN